MGSCEKGHLWNPSIGDCKCNKACKIDKYLDIKNCSCKKFLNGKLVLEYGDEIFNATEALLNDKKLHLQKVIVLYHFIGNFRCIIISCYLCCYFYQAKYQSNQLFHNIKIKLGKIR